MRQATTHTTNQLLHRAEGLYIHTLGPDAAAPETRTPDPAIWHDVLSGRDPATGIPPGELSVQCSPYDGRRSHYCRM